MARKCNPYKSLKIEGLKFQSKFKLFSSNLLEDNSVYILCQLILSFMKNPKIFYLMRHGEADAGFGMSGDAVRPLTTNGKSHVFRVAQVLKKDVVQFDRILCSPAVRTRQTTSILTSELPAKNIQYEEKIYEADPDTLFRLINQVENEVNHLAMVGHNPGISGLLTYLTGDRYISLQPGMLAIIEIQVDEWKEVGRNTGILKEILQ